ncbi:MAG: winged helix-turn-helix domain-containing protein [Candidatus Obscuribacterales bacterium]|nr:winged helix-turn-helix domain-containing protein [Candidatus Obscuribacterales bacterium]
MYNSLFGNNVAKQCLLYIANYGGGHINGIARTFGMSPSQAQRQLEKLEAEGILVSQFYGNTKQFSINPRLPIRNELQALLEKMLSLVPEAETEKYFRQRRRPRRTGKELRQA